MAALVEAAADRTVEGRLTGGFKYGPLTSPTRASKDALSGNIALLGAAGAAQKAAQTDPSPENLHAWGVAQLLLGQYDAAGRDLEESANARPTDGRIAADLAAAYLARARFADRPADWPRALDSAERAIRANATLVEPWFTRAVAVEQLHLDAVQAWHDYLQKDGSSPWAGEAKVRLAAAQKATSVRGRFTDDPRRDPQRVREHLEEDLPAAWGRAVIASDSAAEAQALDEMASIAVAYSQYADDALPADLVRHLKGPRAVVGRRELAQAVVDFAKVAQLVRDDQLTAAEPVLAAVRPVLTAADSPLRLWADYYSVLPLSRRGELSDSLSRLSKIEAVCGPRRYTALCGTATDRRAQIHGRQGDQERAIRERLEALTSFERAKDEDQMAVMHSLIAENYRFLAEPSIAWTHHLASLQLLPRVPNFRSRHLVLVQAGLTCTFVGAYEAAVWFQRAVLDNGRQWRRASGTAVGLFQLSRNLARLGRSDEALAQLVGARAEVDAIPDRDFRERIELDLLEVEAEVFGSRTPAEAIPVLDRAINRFDRTGFGTRLAALHLSRGLLYERVGDRAAAERDWATGRDRLETERRTLSAEDLRMSQAGSLRDIWTAMAVSRIHAGVPPADSLEAIERSRALTLVEHALKRIGETPTIADIQGHLPARSALLYFLVRDQMAGAWLVTSKDVVFRRLRGDSVTIAALVHRYRRVVDTMASEEAFRQVAADVHAALLSPFRSELTDVDALVVVPDALLSGISFAALVDPATKQFEITQRAVAMAPSGSLVIQQAPRPLDGRPLIIGAGAGHDAVPLPWVDEEVSRVSALYDDRVVLEDDAATKANVLAALSHAGVVHFAGHAVSNPISPLLSRLVLNTSAGDTSDIYAYELLQQPDMAASLVVLAACRSGFSARAATDDDGVLELARPFLARGSEAVVASLWDVSDRHSVAVMTRLHTRLRDLPPAAAWRAAILDSIAEHEPVLGGWGAYALFLGRGGAAARPARAVTTTGGVR